jgi:triosephosphate isomerase
MSHVGQAFWWAVEAVIILQQPPRVSLLSLYPTINNFNFTVQLYTTTQTTPHTTPQSCLVNSSSAVTSRCTLPLTAASTYQAPAQLTTLSPNRNGTIESITDIVHKLNDAKVDSNTEIVISPPALYLLLTREHARKGIEVAAQNVFDKPNGAFTGEISVSQLKDSNITWALLGHSERRTILQETDSFIANKTKTAIDGGINVILCCGETLEQRESNKTMDVVIAQLAAVAKQVQDWSKIVVAYEPVWAIGTGKVASTEQAQEVHKGIREWLAKELGQQVAEATRIIYGGSVSEKNCRELAKEADIDGFLVGGASLKPAFVDIINAKQ